LTEPLYDKRPATAADLQMTIVMPLQRSRRFAPSRLAEAGLLTGAVDGTWAIVLTLIYGRSLTRLWQGIAATAFGDRMFDGGAPTVLLGVLMHFGVAFAWSALFLLLVTRSAWLRSVLDSPHGVRRARGGGGLRADDLDRDVGGRHPAADTSSGGDHRSVVDPACGARSVRRRADRVVDLARFTNASGASAPRALMG
jgi:hypothetical protein